MKAIDRHGRELRAVVDVDPHRVEIVLPEDFVMPPGGLAIRWPDPPLEQEARLQRYKVYAALAYARANRLNRIVIDSPRARFGIITDRQVLSRRPPGAGRPGHRRARWRPRSACACYKVGMTWPLEAEGIRHFAEGLEEILVVEEKRQIIEYQLKEELYNWREDVRPRVIGKFDETGEWAAAAGPSWLLPAAGELTPAMIARAIAAPDRPLPHQRDASERAPRLHRRQGGGARPPAPGDGARAALLLGLPAQHHRPRVPEGSRALAGIGCHYMATVDLSPDTTQTFSQMGGEGVPWIGQAPFTEDAARLRQPRRRHLLPLRLAGDPAGGRGQGQHHLQDPLQRRGRDDRRPAGRRHADGRRRSSGQLAAEGVERIVVVTDEPEKYPPTSACPPAACRSGTRRELDAVQRELREIPGVHGADLRPDLRRREAPPPQAQAAFPDPAKRVVINELVCEGCGDCSDKSNCVSVVPVETEFGPQARRSTSPPATRTIPASKGFCPSFVTVEGGKLRRGKALGLEGGRRTSGLASVGGQVPAEGPGAAIGMKPRRRRDPTARP